MQPKEELILKAATLARIAPDDWRNFVEALGRYAEVHRENLIKSPLNELPVNQGRAQTASSLREMLADCLISADRIKGKKPK